MRSRNRGRWEKGRTGRWKEKGRYMKEEWREIDVDEGDKGKGNGIKGGG